MINCLYHFEIFDSSACISSSQIQLCFALTTRDMPSLGIFLEYMHPFNYSISKLYISAIQKIRYYLRRGGESTKCLAALVLDSYFLAKLFILHFIPFHFTSLHLFFCSFTEISLLVHVPLVLYHPSSADLLAKFAQSHSTYTSIVVNWKVLSDTSKSTSKQVCILVE